MLKKIGLPMIALAGLMAFASPRPADARVRFGVSIGGPVYTAPVAPYPYAPAYVDPYYAPAPAYVAPPYYYEPGITFGIGGGWGGGYYGHGYYGRGYENHAFRGGGRSFGHGGGHGRR
jgi:hypothetical protein